MRLIRHQHDPTRPYPAGYRTFGVTVRSLSIVPSIYMYVWKRDGSRMETREIDRN